MAVLRALWAEKLILSLKTLQCWIDLTPKHIHMKLKILEFKLFALKMDDIGKFKMDKCTYLHIWIFQKQFLHLF